MRKKGGVCGVNQTYCDSACLCATATRQLRSSLISAVSLSRKMFDGSTISATIRQIENVNNSDANDVNESISMCFSTFFCLNAKSHAKITSSFLAYLLLLTFVR